jgi:hypothetical protein
VVVLPGEVPVAAVDQGWVRGRDREACSSSRVATRMADSRMDMADRVRVREDEGHVDVEALQAGRETGSLHPR